MSSDQPVAPAPAPSDPPAQEQQDAAAAQPGGHTRARPAATAANSTSAGSSQATAGASQPAASSGDATAAAAAPADAAAAPPAEAWVPTEGRAGGRPCIALSTRLVGLYKEINESYFRKKRLAGDGTKYNDGYDDKDGHYVVLPGEEILERYAVQEVLGKGSFGTVVRALDCKRQETVALKITRNGRNFRNQAKQEIDILLKLCKIPGLTDSFVVRLLKVFDWKGHLCLAFELLSFNLFQLIQCTKYNGVSLDLTRKFAWQILQVLSALQNHKPPIIHCDIKPENILLRYNNRSGIRVIDFGSACYETRRMYKYIQSRFYRSPEVILGLEYTTAIDRWSLGAMLVEMHTGVPLFDGRSEPQQLQRFVGLLGPLPYHMVNSGSKRDTFFLGLDTPAGERNYDADAAPVEHTTAQDGKQYWLKLPPMTRHHRNLKQIIGVNSGGPSGRRQGHPGHDVATYELFYDFVMGLLSFDPAKRLTVAEAMQHPFILPACPQASGSTPAADGASPAGGAADPSVPAVGAAAPPATAASTDASAPAAS